MDLIEGSPDDLSSLNWYDSIRAKLVDSRLSSVPTGGRVLDFGCGNGAVALHILRSRPDLDVWCLDPSLRDWDLLVLRGLGLNPAVSQSDLVGQFDFITLMDVLEHVEKPTVLFRDVISHLATEGRVFITVPAYRWLWSSHDVALGHVDRYSKRRLEQLLRSAGKRINFRCSYVFMILFVLAVGPRFFDRLLKKGTGETSIHRTPKWAGLALSSVSKVEICLFPSGFPFGLTCFADVELR